MSRPHLVAAPPRDVATNEYIDSSDADALLFCILYASASRIVILFSTGGPLYLVYLLAIYAKFSGVAVHDIGGGCDARLSVSVCPLRNLDGVDVSGLAEAPHQRRT